MDIVIFSGVILAVREAPRGRFFDFLTEDGRVLEFFARTSAKNSSPQTASLQCFAYIRLSLQKRADRYFFESAGPIHIFYHLRDSLVSLSLASYFAELISICAEKADTTVHADKILRLLLNSFHFLEERSIPPTQLKSIFELRLCAEIGFMPDLLMCRICGAYEPESLYFSTKSGFFQCEHCTQAPPPPDFRLVSRDVLAACRHIVFSDDKKLFFFRLGDNNLHTLGDITESFLRAQLDISPKTLQFYHTIIATKS